MDLDNFLSDYKAFKARVTPMLEEWERGKIEPVMSDELRAEIYAPIPKGDPMATLGGSHDVVADSGVVDFSDGFRPGGPTIEEWMDRGYRASNYPPHGYAPVSSAEEIAAAQAAEIEAEEPKNPESEELVAKATAGDAEPHKPLPPTSAVS